MDWSGVDYLWIIVMFLSAVWTLILTAPIHCRASIAETLMQWHISTNLMKKQTHLHLGWPEDEHIFIFGWTVPLKILISVKCLFFGSWSQTCSDGIRLCFTEVVGCGRTGVLWSLGTVWGDEEAACHPQRSGERGADSGVSDGAVSVSTHHRETRSTARPAHQHC